MKVSGGGGGALLDLHADDSRAAADVKVFVLDVTESVGEAHHAAIGEFDEKLLVVEVDVELGRDLNTKFS